MTDREVMQMAREAGGCEVDEVDPQCFIGLMAFEVWELERFAALVAAAEREACATLCDNRKALYWQQVDRHGCDADRAAAVASEECAEIIRAKGQK